jgi:phosphoserine phosphatase
VDGRQREPLVVDGAQLIERLCALAPAHASPLLAFDGDGTLWSGDVGEDVFQEAVSKGLLREPALCALTDEARAHGIEAHGSPSEIAARLFAAYRAHRYPEREACAMLTWCYAGMTREELVELARNTFASRMLEQRLQRELSPILSYARSAGLRTVVVSASPQPIVETAAAAWQFAPGDIAASRASERAGRIVAELAAPVPYAECKPSALNAQFPGAALLAAFGDNVFDIELFQSAALAVAVRPKPALKARLSELPMVCILATSET